MHFRNYEQIVKAHQDNPNEGKNQVSDQVKFNVFQGIMDSLFQSFNASISVTSFQELSACVFSWIEEHCKPQVIPQFESMWLAVLCSKYVLVLLTLTSLESVLPPAQRQAGGN